MTTTEPAATAGRIPELDGLRGLAILMVLVWHYVASPIPAGATGLAGGLKQGLSLMWSGVDLFFVLSGLLIGGILIDHREAPHYFKAFYVRRMCRIFPPYFAVLALAALGIASIERLAPAIQWLFQNEMPLWSYATFTQNFQMAASNSFGADALGITWSLAIEEQFYLLLPLVVWLVPPRRLPLLLGACILGAPALRIALFHLHTNASFPGYVLMPARADALLLGVLAAYALRRPGVTQALRAKRVGLYAALAILLMGTALLTLRGPGVGPGSAFEMSYFGHTLLALLYLVMLLLALVERRGPVAALCRLAPLRRLGWISYGVYLIHQLVSGLAHGLLLGQRPRLETPLDAAVTAGALAATLLLAWVSWRVYETPIIDYGHRFGYGTTGRSSEKLRREAVGAT